MFELSIGPQLWTSLPADPGDGSPVNSADDLSKPASKKDSDSAPSRRFIRSTKVNTFGLGESLVAQRLGELMARGRNPQVGTTVTDGIISVRIRSEAGNRQIVAQGLDETVQQVENLLGPLCFGRDEQTLQDDLVRNLREKKLTLATAESCTGGLIGELITQVSGSSDIYLGGWITYSNQMKIAQLAVPEPMIEQYGAVSQEVATSMAKGALAVSGADLAVGVTGIAGPGGGSAEKPVGTVWLALAWRSSPEAEEKAGNQAGGLGIETEAKWLQLAGDRATVRDRAAKHVLQWLRFHLRGISMDSVIRSMSDPVSS